MKFSDIPGHEDVKETLRQMVREDKIPHAIMLAGPKGAGKMMLARAFMQYVHCQNPQNGEPCEVCPACKLHKEIDHPDVHFSFPYLKKNSSKTYYCDDYKEEFKQFLMETPTMSYEHWLEILHLENQQPKILDAESEEIIRIASFPPYTSKMKFFVIWLPEKMNREMANKILKVVEEPSSGICFLMVSNNSLEVLPTISSRTRPLHVGKISSEDIYHYLMRRWRLDDNTAFRIAPLCDGSLIRADELGSHTGENDEFRNISQQLMRNAYSRAVGSLKKLSEDVAAMGREKIIRFLTYLANMFRENFIYNLRMPPLNRLTPEEEQFSRNFAPFVNVANIEELSAETDRAILEISRNCNSKIVLFDFFLLCIPLIRRKPE